MIGEVTAVYLLIHYLIGRGFGPFVVALVSDAFFTGPQALGFTLGAATAVLMLLALAMSGCCCIARGSLCRSPRPDWRRLLECDRSPAYAALEARRMSFRKLPWFDYGGRFSPLKAGAFVALFVPGVYIAVSFQLDRLGARPLTEAILEYGNWTIRLIFIALAISPARLVLQWPRLLQVRRMVGVAACVYGLIHLSLYAADEAFNLATVVSEIVLRIYLTIGFTALFGLGVLAVTSTDGWQRRLGARRWQKLHRVVYVVGLLAVIHFCMQSKLDEWEPTVMAGIYFWLMACRVAIWRRGRSGLSLWLAASLSLAAGILTALGEAIYFGIAMGAPIGLVLMADLSLQTGLRPAWVVVASTGGIAVLGTLRAVVWRGKARPRATV